MAGRPKKKPEYNPELQFNNFLQELRDAYEEAASLRSLADELNISLLKLRKLLITADVFTSDICTEINNLHQSGKKISEIMKLTGLSRASVHSYLPYTKGLYNATEISQEQGNYFIWKGYCAWNWTPTGRFWTAGSWIQEIFYGTFQAWYLL